METKTCKKCGETKSTDEFGTNGTLKDGSPKYHTWCRSCKSAEQKKRYAEGKKDPEYMDRRRESQAKYRRSGRPKELAERAKQHYVDLKGGKCERCGYDKCLGALEFHHRDPSTKKYQLNETTLACSGKHEEHLKELEKCDLLCANCHREVHCLL